MRDSVGDIRMAVLRVLAEAGRPLGAGAIAERLSVPDLQPRTVRYHLLRMDRDGWTRCVSRRKGRTITDAGRLVLGGEEVVRRVGMMSARIDALGMTMRFSVASGTGTLIANAGLIGKVQLARALEDMKHVFVRRLGMGGRIALVREGENFAGMAVPRGQVAVGTVSSATIHGLLLGSSIPVVARFGGLLEMRDGKPLRFVEAIDYAGSSLDPLELFIKSGLTRVRLCARSGSGVIGASFREFPAVALDKVLALRNAADRQSLGGVIAMGRPGQPLLDIPVAAERVGMVVVAGLNPLAALHEAGIAVELRPLHGVVDYALFQSFQVWRERFSG